MSALLALACATCMAKYQHADFVPKQTSIKPGAGYEECFAFQAGEGLRYAYESSAPLTFRLYYREGDKVLSPVPEVSLKSLLPQRFVAEKQRDYCLSWRNVGKRTVALQYRYVAEYHLEPQIRDQ
ncbi:hypothetical protein [Chitinimonas naiadis]